VSGTSLRMYINTTAVTQAWWVQVLTGVSASSQYPFQVVVPGGALSLSGVNPSTVSGSDAAQTLALQGSGFTSSSRVLLGRVDGWSQWAEPGDVTYVGSSQLNLRVVVGNLTRDWWVQVWNSTASSVQRSFSVVALGGSLAPTGFTVEYTGKSPDGYPRLHLAWSPVAGATGYRMYARAGGGMWSYLGPRDAANPNFDSYSYASAIRYAPGSTYYFKVSATNGTAEGAFSVEVSVTVPTGPSIHLLAPLAGASWRIGDTVAVGWDERDTTEGDIQIFVSATKGVWGSAIATRTIGPNQCRSASFVVPSLPSGSYYARIEWNDQCIRRQWPHHYWHDQRNRPGQSTGAESLRRGFRRCSPDMESPFFQRRIACDRLPCLSQAGVDGIRPSG
jgi:hypothetical protein